MLRRVLSKANLIAVRNQLLPRSLLWQHPSTRLHSSNSLRAESCKSADDVIRSYDRTWLRENCHCPQCYNHSTQQRTVMFYELKPEAKTISKVEQTPSGDSITIHWQDGHMTVYGLTWLANNSYPGPVDAVERRLWKGAELKVDDLDRVPSETFLNEEAGVKRLIRNLLVYGFGLVEGVEPTLEATRTAVERVSYVQETLFGQMFHVIADGARDDMSYTKLSLEPHVDTPYLYHPAGIQVFHCIQHDGDGGETLLVDGFRAAEELRQAEPQAFDTLCRLHVDFQNQDGDDYYIKYAAPILTVHPVSGRMEMIRYNINDRAPAASIPQHELAAFYDALAALCRRVKDPEGEFWIKLRPGTVLFVDNWRVMHGRKAFTGDRHLVGCYLPKEEVMNRARLWHMVA